MRKLIVFMAIAFCMSCASTAIFQSLDEIRYQPTQRVEVFLTKMPTRSYTEIGRIEVSQGLNGTSDMIEVAVQKAKEIGADALILLTEDKETGYIAISNMVLPASVQKLVFVAIKYER
jgi:hypothetical protein